MDTSALVKLYIAEAGSEALRNSLDNAVVAVSALTYGEVYATFARRLREDLMTQDEHSLCCQSFEEDWATLIQIPFTKEVLRPKASKCSS